MLISLRKMFSLPELTLYISVFFSWDPPLTAYQILIKDKIFRGNPMVWDDITACTVQGTFNKRLRAGIVCLVCTTNLDNLGVVPLKCWCVIWLFWVCANNNNYNAKYRGREGKKNIVKAVSFSKRSLIKCFTFSTCAFIPGFHYIYFAGYNDQ